MTLTRRSLPADLRKIGIFGVKLAIGEKHQGETNMLRFFATTVAVCASAGAATAATPCSIPQHIVNAVQSQLASVVKQNNGGFFSPNLMWSAIVDRQGRLCSVIKTGDAFPASRAIAIAKATTANGFSNSKSATSTANLYGQSQPGGSLYGLNNSNPFNPGFQEYETGIGEVPGGIIVFGGGVPLYYRGQVIGGLGLSGDTSCADHAIAYRMRRQAGLDGTPNSDNIVYYPYGTTIVTLDPTQYAQPHCLPTDVTP